MFNIAVCDDDAVFTKSLYNKINLFLTEENISGNVDIYNSGYELLNSRKKYSLYMLDIEMKEISGMQLAKYINKFNGVKPIIILVTNYDKYVYQAFELDIFRYLRKSKIDLLLDKYLRAAIDRYETMQPKSYTITKKTQVVDILFSNIIYIDKANKNIVFHTSSGSVYKERKTLKDICSSLDKRFIFTDRCCIVNIEYISSIINSKVLLTNGTEIIMSRNRITKVKQAVSEYWRDIT